MATTSTYSIDGKSFGAGTSELQHALRAAHGDKKRPTCQCRTPGVPMYVAKVGGTYCVKRMPDTGSDHAPACDSYEPPPELSGLGQVSGSAISEDPDGITTLKFDFALTKKPGRAAPTIGDGCSDSVATDGNKLSLRGTLHYLLEEAGFNRWTPAMKGKRSWFVVRRHLLEAAENKMAKGTNLGDVLYIPESFNLDKKDEIAQRRQAQWMKIASVAGGTRRLMLAVGEVKAIEPSRYGFKIVLKHLPDAPLMLNEDIHKRMNKRFAQELGLWDAVDDSHLLVICTFCIGSTGIASVEELALVLTLDSWIPFENLYEKVLLDKLIAADRRFTKGMRYNLPAGQPLAVAVLTDTQPEATALYVDLPGATDTHTAVQDKLIEDSKLSAWRWDTSNTTMPALP